MSTAAEWAATNWADEIEKIKVACEEQKAVANEKFKKSQWSAAVHYYTEALETFYVLEEKIESELGESDDARRQAVVALAHETVPRWVYHSNRAFAYIKDDAFGSAIADADAAIQLKPTFAKAYYRRGTANLAMCKPKKALKDFKTLCKLVPSDADARSKFKACEKLVRQEAFLAAIASDNSAVFHDEDLSAMPIPSGYEGVVYERIDGDGKSPLSAEWVQRLLDQLEKQQALPTKCVAELLLDVQKVLARTAPKALVRIDSKGDDFTVCGDVHGQFYDLLNIFKLNGLPSETNQYLFNGDFVDRGSFSVECIVTLFVLKVIYPQHFFMARGNHETRNMSMMYGFQGEVAHKYNDRMYNTFAEVFCALPLAHVVNDAIFVTHGGLFQRDNVTLKDIEETPFHSEPPEGGLFTDLLWSDPQPQNGRSPSKRGVGCGFGPDVTLDFLQTNDLRLVVRSHEMQEEGYQIMHGGKLVTVFSAPNYVDSMGNSAAFVRFEDGHWDKPKYTQYQAVPHPDVRAMQYANPLLYGLMGR